MQVAVTRMAERANEHVVLDTHIMNKAQEFSDFIDGDHHVHLIEMLGFGLDYREKRAARRPYRRLVGWVLDNERIEGARFFANFGQRFGALKISSSSLPSSVTRIYAPHSLPSTTVGIILFPVYSAEESTISRSMNSIDCGFKPVSLIFGTVANSRRTTIDGKISHTAD